MQKNELVKNKDPFSRNRLLKRITITAVFVALACVTSLIAGFRLPLFGGDGMHVNLSGIFSSFPAILFGPAYGAASSVFMDLFGCIVKPSGAYNPLFTLTALCTGFFRGFFWWAVLKIKDNKKLGISAVCVLVLIGTLGVVNHVSFRNDQVLTGFLPTTQNVATKGQVQRLQQQKDLSVFSYVLTSLATDDSMQVRDCTAEGPIVAVPSKADYDGCAFSVTSIGSGAFRDKGIQTVVLPSTVKTIAEDAFDDGTTVVISDEVNEKTGQLKSKNAQKAVSQIEQVQLSVVSAEEYDQLVTQSTATLSFSSNEAYRNDLALYASGLTIGLELVCLIGLIFVVVDQLLMRRRDKAQKPAVSVVGLFAAILGAGLIGSTLNTVWLSLLYYGNKAFWILWVPRTIQEIIITTVQVCIIAFLYELFLIRVYPRFRDKHLIMQKF